MKINVELSLVKETKNTYVYAAATSESDDIVPTLYIKKCAFPDLPPAHITITISEGHE